MRGLIHTLSKGGTRVSVATRTTALPKPFLYSWHNRAFPTYNFRNSIQTREITNQRKQFIPSAEQQVIVDLCPTHNVVVSARPGSGKTATAEAIVAANPNRPIAVVTYSKRLQLDTKRRLQDYSWADVSTFHSLAGKLFSTTVFNDAILRSLRRAKTIPVWTHEPYEIIILDEMQDCTDDLFWLICALISAVTRAANGNAPRIVVHGDERQAIYDYRGADARYLSMAPSIMATVSPYQWTHSTLSKSFRLSQEKCSFINNVFLGGEQYIVGYNNGPKPLYLLRNIFSPRRLANDLLPLILQHGPKRTAILAPSVRGNKPLSGLTNCLSEMHRIPIAVSTSDDIPLDEQVLQGKIVVSSYHQSKGSERDLVIVYGVDAKYFEYIGRDLPDDTCPNATFVALTRACKQLVLVHHIGNALMPFVDVPQLLKLSNILGPTGCEKKLTVGVSGRPITRDIRFPRKVRASELPRHVPDEVLEGICTKHLEIVHTRPPLPIEQHIKAPAIVLTDEVRQHYEAVSDLNGLAIQAAFEYSKFGTLTSVGFSKELKLELPADTGMRAAKLCHYACDHDARMSGYKSCKIQMKGHSFSWLGNHLDLALGRLKSLFPETVSLDFETYFIEEFSVEDPAGGEPQTTELEGIVDIIQHPDPSSTSVTQDKELMNDQNIEHLDAGVTIWEIKFVAQLSHEHVIQVCIYAYLWSKKHKREVPPRMILSNVRDGEKWEITPHNALQSLRNVIEETMVAKYTTKGTLTTDEFLDKCAKTKSEVEEALKD